MRSPVNASVTFLAFLMAMRIVVQNSKLNVNIYLHFKIKLIARINYVSI